MEENIVQQEKSAIKNLFGDIDMGIVYGFTYLLALGLVFKFYKNLKVG